MENKFIDRITVNPEICHGKPTIRNKRYTVGFILDLLYAGSTHAEILEDFPKLEEEDILACLAYERKITNYSSDTKISGWGWLSMPNFPLTCIINKTNSIEYFNLELQQSIKNKILIFRLPRSSLKCYCKWHKKVVKLSYSYRANKVHGAF